MIAATCPHCRRLCQAPESLANRLVNCPNCRQVFPVSSQAVSAGSAPQRTLLAKPEEAAIRYSCPRCNQSMQSPASSAGQKLNCPRCGQRLQIPRPSTPPCPPIHKTILATEESAVSVSPHLSATAPPTPGIASAPDDKTTEKAIAPRSWRYFSSPWVVTIFLFGFLPWSEVSCNKINKEVEIEFRATQSGYQAVYGGVSGPPALEAMASTEEPSERENWTREVREVRNGMQNHELRAQLRMLSYLGSVSPFLLFFWSANLALLGLICFAPLGGHRLRFALPLCGLLFGMLVVHACLGLPLERRAALMIAEAIREDHSKGMMLVMALRTGKTAWYWLTLASVLLLAVSELLLNHFRREDVARTLAPAGMASVAVMLALGGVLFQYVLWKAEVVKIEERIAQFQQAEGAKRRKDKAEADRVEAEAKARTAEAERQRRVAEAETARARDDAERMRHEADLREQETRLRELQRQREREEEERQRRKQQERDELRRFLEKRKREAEERRQAEQKAADEAARETARRKKAERKEKEEADREEARKDELERKGLPYYPRPLTLYGDRNAKEWYEMLLDKPRDGRVYALATKALVALKEEGTPFLVSWLESQETPQGRFAALQLLQVEYLHRHDLPKLLSCLDGDKNSPGTRLLALKYLESRAKDLKKDLVAQIEGLVDDLLTSPRFKEETKGEVRRRIRTLRKEAN